MSVIVILREIALQMYAGHTQIITATDFPYHSVAVITLIFAGILLGRRCGCISNEIFFPAACVLTLFINSLPFSIWKIFLICGAFV